jgi:hypothetical protein
LEKVDMDESVEIRSWLLGRIPSGWYTEAPEISVDRDEILVIGRIPDVQSTGDVDLSVARGGRARQHREDTREERMRIAQEAQRKFSRHVSWGVRVGDTGHLFTHLAMPVMTRLRMRERQILDRLVASGVVQNRSQALAWCIALVAQHQAEWLKDLDDAMNRVQQIRERAPKLN